MREALNKMNNNWKKVISIEEGNNKHMHDKTDKPDIEVRVAILEEKFSDMNQTINNLSVEMKTHNDIVVSKLDKLMKLVSKK